MRISDWSSDVCSSDLKDAAGRADLDDARAELVQPAHLAARFLGAVDHRRLLAVHRRRKSAAVAMPAGSADHTACGDDARSRNIAALDRRLAPDIPELGRADVANRADALADGRLRLGPARERT